VACRPSTLSYEVIMLQSVDDRGDLAAGLYRSPQNAGPRTRAMFEYQDMCVVLRCIPNLLPKSSVLAVAVEWSTDYALLGREAQRELVSVKHRGSGQGDWTFSRLAHENVFRDLHATWRAMGRKGGYLFESNAGFERELRPFIEGRPAGGRREQEAAHRLAECLAVGPEEASQFMRQFRLRGDPLPGWSHIEDVATQRLGEVMTRLGLDAAYAGECVAALAERIAAASTQRPPDARQRVERLAGFMQDIAGWTPNDPPGTVVVMGNLREVVAETSRARASKHSSARKGAGRQAEEDIQQSTSEPDENPGLAYHETLRVIRNRTHELIDREREIAELRAFAAGEEEPRGNGYLWVCGAPWAGKTALLAEAVQALSAERETDVVAYFLVARESQASREQFLSAVTGQLAWLLHTRPPPVPDVHSFRQLWAIAARRAENEESPRQLILIVDGLDEDLQSGGHSVAALLPTEHLGRHVRVLVSARPHPDIPLDVDRAHPLHKARVMNLAESPHATAIRGRAEQEIGAILSGGEGIHDLAFDILGLLTAAVGALSVEDVGSILGASRRDIRSFISSRAARSVKPAGSPREERYSFAHQTLLDFCATHPDLGGEQAHFMKILNWARVWEQRGWPNAYYASSSTPTYLLDSYPTAIAQSRLPSARELLADLVTNERWVDTALTRVGSQSVMTALHTAIDLNPELASLDSWRRVVEHRVLMSGQTLKSPGWTQASLAWDAAGHGEEANKTEAIRNLRHHGPPYLIPVWMSTPARGVPAFTPAEGAIRALAITPTAKLVSGGGVDGSLLLWDPAIADAPPQEIGNHDDAVLAATATEDGFIAAGSIDGTINLWNPSSPKEAARRIGRCRDRVRVLAITPEGMIVSGSHDGEIRLWDHAGRTTGSRVLGKHDNQVRGLGITIDGMIVTGSIDGSIRIWDPHKTKQSGRLLGRHGPIMSLTMAAGRYVIAAGLNGYLWLWDVRRPTRGYIEMIPDRPARSVTATPDGCILFGCSDGSLGIWDPAVTGNRGLLLCANRGAVGSLVTAPGNRIFAANGQVITMFTLAIS
jgi:hypothetical protein